MKQMKNLLKETLKALEDEGLCPDDIVFIGSPISQHSCSWEEFEVLADFEYDCGYGSQNIAEDLVIVLRNGSWFTRGEYDGSEWWEYQKLPEISPAKGLKPIKSLLSRFDADDLAEIQNNLSE